MSISLLSFIFLFVPHSAAGVPTNGDATLRSRTVSLTACAGDVLVRVREEDPPQHGLRLRLASVSRGSGQAHAPQAANLRLADGLLCLERGTLEERYELRANGVEQSFVFAELPPGEGDLVVRVQVETALALVSSKRAQVSFQRVDADGATRLTVAGIVGIDAGGARVDGSMAWSQGVLELRIPGDFVHAAALPLVVDPLITGEITLDTFPIVYSPQTSIAYLADADRFFAAWSGVSGPDEAPFPRGRVIAGDWTPLGAAAWYSLEPDYLYDTQVTSVRAARLFVAASIGAVFAGHNPWVASIDENGTFVEEERVSFLSTASIDVGGEATLQGEDVLVACASFGRGITLYRVEATTLGVQESLLLTPDGSGDREIAISPSGGTSGRYLVTWSRFQSGDRDVWASVVDRDANVLVAPFPVADSSADEREPDVDGDGTHWLVVYERGTSPDFDIAGKSITYVPASGSVHLASERIVEGDVGQPELDPAVAWMGESAVIVWSEQFSGADYDVYLKSVETFGGLDCEGESLVANPPTADEGPAIVSKLSAGGTGSDALVTWMRTKELAEPPFVVGSTHARAFHADDGTLVDLGGGCGAGGKARATCAASGATNFGLSLDAAAPVQPCGLLLGLDPLNLVCGPCTLVLDPLVAFLTTTDASGHAAFTFPMPGAVSFAGAQFLAQWFVRSPSCGNFSFSNALEITVE